jgi:hypothetical protein
LKAFEEEHTMRRLVILTMFAAFAAAATMSTPAAATDINEARAQCSKNPNCNELPGTPGGFCINTEGTQDCKHYVDCPTDGGACGVMWLQSNGTKKNLGTKVVTKYLIPAGGVKTTSKTKGPPPSGILGSGPEMGSQRPSATGAPAAAPPAPPVKIF